MKIIRFLSTALTFSILLSFAGVLRAEEPAKTAAPVAKIGNVVLTDDQLHKDSGMNLYQAESQLYTMKKGWVDQKAQPILFALAAKDAGLSISAWQTSEIDKKMTQPTQQEIDQATAQMAQRSGAQGAAPTLTDAQYAAQKKQAKDYLMQQKRAARESEVYQQLTQKYPVELFFTKPEAPHINVTFSKNNPVKGPKDAKVVVMEFTDFQCPWCKRSQDSVKAMEQVYGDKIKMVDRMFPLTGMHPRAMPSAEAAYCAKEQGKYWEYRDKLFASQALTDADFQQYAKETSLNESKFNNCLSSHKYTTEVQTDMADGQRFGVQGTPTFFVNGIQTGFPQLQETVKSELDKIKG